MINEFKIICDAMDVDPFEVIDAASTKPLDLFHTILDLDGVGIVYQWIHFIYHGKQKNLV